MSAAGASGAMLADAAALRRLHVYADCLLVAAAWLGAYATRRLLDPLLGYPINEAEVYLAAVPLIVAPWIASCWGFGLYQPTRMKSGVDQIQELLRGALLGLLVISTIGYFFRELAFGRMVVLLAAGYSLLFQGASRFAFFRWEARLRASGRLDVPTLILGAGTVGIRVLQKLQDHPETGYRVVGFLDDDPELAEAKVGGCPVLGTLADLRARVLAHGVREVVVATPGMGHTSMLSRVLECEDLDVTFHVVTNLFEVLTAGTPVDLVDDLPLVRLGGRRPSPAYAVAKRAFDLFGAALGSLLLAPCLGWCALRIKLDSPGPVLFRQARVGRGGRHFTLYKLRSMRSDSEPYAVAPRAGDDVRVTAYGAWLRRTSIDELPQLWNVLRGEMSLVGPRPEMPFIVESYDEWQRRRLTVKPGITGLWQILGRKDLPMHENLQYDFYYIRNRSFGLDLSILMRTVAAVLSRRGAY